MLPSVLLADNDAAVSGLLAEVLRRSGVEVEQVFDGEAARRRASERVPDVLVCDLDMPKMSGIDVLEALRDQPRQPPTLVISGYLDAAIEARLAQLPFVHTVLRKPFDLMMFAGLVRELASAGGAGPAGEREASA
ncbi:MAG: response regulator [Planctomycetes bacterium]|nr:response regulator [Planctomycetota bacterium]MCB9887857.1 response regulator [Planctomycetota bacterium]